jgi:hypothetical protein
MEGTGMSRQDRYLVLSDQQMPFDDPDGLKFALAVAKEFRIPKDNVLNVSDLFDQYNASSFPKSPDARYTANQEIEETRKRLKPWFQAFPKMRLALCNHGERWDKKAKGAGIPSQLIKAYAHEVIGVPKGWEWKYGWKVETEKPFWVIHGMGYGGEYGHKMAALDYGCSVAMGHLHCNAGVIHLKTRGVRVWGMAVGCLIDYPEDDIDGVIPEAYEYQRDSRRKPIKGLGVVLDGGRTPIFLPKERL